MPRDLRQHEGQKRAKARRDHALARREFAYPSVPRSAAAGPTSPAVKIVDPESAAAIAAFMNKRVTT